MAQGVPATHADRWQGRGPVISRGRVSVTSHRAALIFILGILQTLTGRAAVTWAGAKPRPLRMFACP